MNETRGGYGPEYVGNIIGLLRDEYIVAMSLIMEAKPNWILDMREGYYSLKDRRVTAPIIKAFLDAGGFEAIVKQEAKEKKAQRHADWPKRNWILHAIIGAIGGILLTSAVNTLFQKGQLKTIQDLRDSLNVLRDSIYHYKNHT